MSQEATGLVTHNAEFLQGWGAQRILTSYLNEQAATAIALRNDVKEAQERERRAAAEASDLRSKLAVSKAANETEKKLRTPRALFSLIGLSVAAFGVDQFGSGNRALGIALVAVGILTVVLTNLIGPADGANQ